MIISALISLVFGILKLLISIIPTINIDLTGSNGVVSWALNIFDSINYFVPVASLLTILGLKIVIHNFHFIISLFKNIWSMLPFVH